MGALHRQPSEFAPSMYGIPSVPAHLRNEMQQPSPRSSPALTSQPYTPAMQPHQQQARAPLTSHPAGYGPPSVLEPPTSTNNAQSNSANGSPHMSAMGWQSPGHQGLPSPSGAEYSYPDPQNYGNPHSNLYYANANMQRPRSTEPDHYDPRQAGWSHMGAGATGAVNHL
ncbi:MAG: hypothetical protein INR71_12100 [Terriglobus roseus]|nr:hypothetical protein [Terriglobus roseus]